MTPTAVVIPCYNEEHRLDAGRFLAFARQHPSLQLVFVNDGSRDGTLRCLQEIRQQSPQSIDIVDLEQNCGKAEAVRQGMLHAFSNPAATYAGYLDADLATPLDAIVEFAEMLDRYPPLELVMGARLRLLGRRINRRPVRRWVGRLCAAGAGLALGQPVRDTQCGAKLFRVTATTREIFADPLETRWIFDVELLARMIRLVRGSDSRFSDRVLEHPLMQWDEVPGSKLATGDFVRAGLELWKIWRHYRWSQAATPTAVPVGNGGNVETPSLASGRRAA